MLTFLHILLLPNTIFFQTKEKGIIAKYSQENLIHILEKAGNDDYQNVLDNWYNILLFESKYPFIYTQICL